MTFGKCNSCLSRDSEIKYLRDQIEKFRVDWQNERAEFKRTVDSLIEMAGARPPGQGLPTERQEEMPNIDNVMGIFDEVVSNG